MSKVKKNEPSRIRHQRTGKYVKPDSGSNITLGPGFSCEEDSAIDKFIEERGDPMIKISPL